MRMHSSKSIILHSSWWKWMTSRGVSFSRVVTSTIHFLHTSSAFSSCTSPTQKSISVKSLRTLRRMPLTSAKICLLAETQPRRMSSQRRLHLAFSKRSTKAPPFWLRASSQTGLMFSWKRQMQEPTGSSVGRLKCWQQAQNSSMESIAATGLRLSSKVPSPFTKCWYQNCSRVASPDFSIKYPQQLIQIKCSIINYPMQALPPTPFLQKFHGKQQKVNRDGILELLQQDRASKATKKETANPETQNIGKTSSIREAISMDLKANLKIKAETPQKQSSKEEKNIFSSQQLKGSHSERALDNMAFHLSKRSEFKPFAAEQLKLPPISRSSSQNGKLQSREAFNPKAEMLESDRSHRKKESSGSFYSKHTDRASRQIDLDEYVLRHMEFLHKFEKQLISNRLSHGSKLKE